MQQRFWPDPQPLVERLGRDFFRNLPERPGVYLMRDASDVVLYVGKARNLRQRLGSYRIANPDRMPRRHMRLLRAVARIEHQECPDESSALARESELLRTIRPRFNRAGIWPAPTRFLAWRCAEQQLHLAVVEAADPNWHAHGPFGGAAIVLHGVLTRLLWLAVHPQLGFAGLPVGWVRGRLDTATTIHCGTMIEPVAASLQRLLSGQTEQFCDWVRARLPGDLHLFDQTAVATDLEILTEASLKLQSAPGAATLEIREESS